MSTIGKIFGQSPFGLLQRHMGQVAKCVAKMVESLESLEQGSWDKVQSCAEEASILEHQADQIKDDIRNHLYTRFFIPVARVRVLETLAIQDNLADLAEDVCLLLTFRQLTTPPGMAEKFTMFRDMNIKAFHLVEAIIEELDELIEAGFGGAEAEKVRNMVHEVALAEHQADVLQRELLKELFSGDTGFSAEELHLWTRLAKELGDISNEAENLANCVRNTLELK